VSETERHIIKYSIIFYLLLSIVNSDGVCRDRNDGIYAETDLERLALYHRIVGPPRYDVRGNKKGTY